MSSPVALSALLFIKIFENIFGFYFKNYLTTGSKCGIFISAKEKSQNKGEARGTKKAQAAGSPLGIPISDDESLKTGR